MRLLREPLVQFLVLGALLFLSNLWLGHHDNLNRIVVTRSTIEHLAEEWTQNRQQPPTPHEMQSLIDDYVLDEILNREARALRLDEDDIVVRRRLREKLETMVADSADVPIPTDKQLETYLKSHPSRFRLDATISFEQIFFNEEIRGAAAVADASSALTSLRDGLVADPRDLGDGIPLPYELEASSSWEIASMLGADFAAQLASLSVGEWSGPIRSELGLHLVRINELRPGRDPSLDEVRDLVAREWTADQRRSQKEQFFDSIVDRYDVVIEGLFDDRQR